MPLWVSLLTNIGIALVKWGASETSIAINETREAAEKERASGVRNGENAKKYQAATTRSEQIRAAIDLINRNST